MTVAGLVVMLVSMVTVLSLTVFCFYKILTEKHREHPAPIDIDTKDREEP
jgi:hypothetical protein